MLAYRLGWRQGDPLSSGSASSPPLTMRTTGAFTLHVEPATEAMPARVSVVLTGATPNARGILHLTPDCLTLDELESRLNALQDELGILRAEGPRRAGPSAAPPATHDPRARGFGASVQPCPGALLSCNDTDLRTT